MFLIIIVIAYYWKKHQNAKNKIKILSCDALKMDVEDKENISTPELDPVARDDLASKETSNTESTTDIIADAVKG